MDCLIYPPTVFITDKEVKAQTGKQTYKLTIMIDDAMMMNTEGNEGTRVTEEGRPIYPRDTKEGIPEDVWRWAVL